MYRGIIYLLFLSTAFAQLDLDKTCNFTDLITSFNVSKIAGRWYQLARIENTFETGDCSTTTFTAILSNRIPTALDFSSREVVGGKLVYRNASVSFSSSYLGVLNFTFADGNSSDYVIMPVTPYGHESMVLYSCQNNGNRSWVWAWKLGKTLTQSPQARNATEKLVAGVEDLSNATWRTTSFSEAACSINGGVKFRIISPFMVLLVSLALIKKMESE